MTRTWYHIARAEYLVSTSSLKGKRMLSLGALLIFGLIWAVFLAPFIIGTVVNLILPFENLRILLVTLLPGFMRAVMFFLWMMLLIIPLSRALQEVKIGQWEIFLANNVKTRDMLIGTFLGKVPIYGLLILYLAPPLLAIFFLAFEVALIGQVLVYLTILAMILTTIWFANFITAAIQAKLGESARGKDLANGLAILLAIITIIPMYGIMFFSQQLSTILGLNVFLFFPFTWPADVISWTTIFYSQIGFTPNHILVFQQVLQFDIIASTTLLIGFGLAIVVIGLVTADRVFTYNIGARTEEVTTIHGENILLRGIRKIASGSFGALVVTCLKEFFRKAANLSKIAYGVILAVVLPLLMSQMSLVLGYDLDLMILIMGGGTGMALIGAFTFGGTAFMESKDQLWIIQSTPSGTTRFIKARIIAAFITALPLSILPSLVMTIIATGGIDLFFILFGYGYLIICGAIMFSTGVTALNPHYENMKSPEHQMNLITSTMGTQFTLFGPILLTLIGDMIGLPFWDILKNAVGIVGMPIAFALIGSMSLLFVGGLALLVGTYRLSRPEN